MNTWNNWRTTALQHIFTHHKIYISLQYFLFKTAFWTFFNFLEALKQNTFSLAFPAPSKAENTLLMSYVSSLLNKRVLWREWRNHFTSLSCGTQHLLFYLKCWIQKTTCATCFLKNKLVKIQRKPSYSTADHHLSTLIVLKVSSSSQAHYNAGSVWTQVTASPAQNWAIICIKYCLEWKTVSQQKSLLSRMRSETLSYSEISPFEME